MNSDRLRFTMLIQDMIPVGPKTTMRIGGKARFYGEILTQQDMERAVTFAKEKNVPLILLGSGSNTVFADDTIDALVVRIKAETVQRKEHRLIVQAGKNLATFVNECAEIGLDLSALTGIPGTLGGALFGNAGQGPKGTWLDAFVVDVTAYVDEEWKTFTKEDCHFRYRESVFKDIARDKKIPPIIWEATLEIPGGDPVAIKQTIESLLQKRIETQPHVKTAGSCFKAVGTEPAWKLIDAAGMRGMRIGGIEISPKHANFLINAGGGTFEDAKRVVESVKTKVPHALDVEMRFIEPDGSLAF